MNELKELFKNVYFIIGNAYAGKSTMVKLLAKKYNGVLCEENYHNVLLDVLDKNEYPGLTYTRDLEDFHEFIRRSPDEYTNWIYETSKECEKLELILLKERVKEGKKVFVDTNISIETLKKIASINHVLVMLADPEISINRFFEREDREKQFLYRLLQEEENPIAAMANFRECLRRINSKEDYDKYLNCGFNVLLRDDNRSIEDTLKIVEKKFEL